MIASSIVLLRYFFLAVTLLLCSGDLLADSRYYLIERWSNTEREASGASVWGGKALAILEADGVLPINPEYFATLPGLTATQVGRLTAYKHIERMVPHVKADCHTLSVFGEQLFTLLYNDSATNVVYPKMFFSNDQKIYDTSLMLDVGSVQDKDDMQRLIRRLKHLQTDRVPYLMTHFIYHKERKTVEIKLEMWIPDLLASEKKMAQLLDRKKSSLHLQRLTREQLRARSRITRKPERRTERDTASGEGTSAGTALGGCTASTAADISWLDALRSLRAAVNSPGSGAIERMLLNAKETSL